MYALLNIPPHKGCRNCGFCCGIVPVDDIELAEIEKHLKEHPKVWALAIKQSEQVTCPFRDEENKNCAIYPVRPIVCRLFGVAKGMECIHGGSMEIDGEKFLSNSKPSEITLLNDLDWRVIK